MSQAFRNIILIAFAFAFVAPTVSWAEKPVAIGYELMEEIQDAPTKTYTIRFEFWSNDEDVKLFAVTPYTETTGLNIKTKRKTWSGIKKGQRTAFSVSAVNSGKETRTLLINIKRKTEKRTDTKVISVLVAPQ